MALKTWQRTFLNERRIHHRTSGGKVKLEIILAFLENFRGLAIVSAAIAGFTGVIFLACLADSSSDLSIFGGETYAKRVTKYKTLWWKPFIIAALIMPFALVPSIDQVWKIRIGLIKLQLASPDNIQKGAEVIERIGHKLECKYLGCKEEKQESSSEDKNGN